jgi:hypothetical protein
MTCIYIYIYIYILIYKYIFIYIYIYIYIWLTAVGSGGTTLGGELCRFLDLVGHGAKFDQTESCGSSVERGPG